MTSTGLVRSLVFQLRRDAIVRNTAFLILAQGCLAFVGFTFWLAATHLANAATLGEATTLVSGSTLIAFLGMFGINTTFMRFLPASKDGSAELSSGLIASFVGTGILALIWVEAVPSFIPKLAFIERSPAQTCAFVLFTAFGGVNGLTSSIFLARQRASYILITDGVIQGAVKIGAPIFLLFVGGHSDRSAFSIFCYFGLAYVADVVVSIAIISFRLGYHLKLIIRLQSLRHEVRFTAANYVVAILDLLPTLLLPSIILDGAGATSAGYFYICFQISAVVSGVGISVAVSTLAEGSQRQASLRQVVTRSSRLLVFVLPPLVLAGAALAPLILSFFGSPYRQHGTTALQMLILAAPAVALCQWTRALLQLRKNLRGLLYSQGAYAVLVLGGSVSLADRGIVWISVVYLLGNLIAGAFAGGILLISTRAKFLEKVVPT